MILKTINIIFIILFRDNLLIKFFNNNKQNKKDKIEKKFDKIRANKNIIKIFFEL